MFQMFGENYTLNATTSLSNDSEEDDGYTPYNERPETYIVPVVFLIILVVGVAGNGALVLTLLRHANMRNVPNTYVLSLALGDLLVSDRVQSFFFFRTSPTLSTLTSV